jgi:hypothetical protein
MEKEYSITGANAIQRDLKNFAEKRYITSRVISHKNIFKPPPSHGLNVSGKK